MKSLQILKKNLMYEKFYVHEKNLCTRNCRRKFIKTLLHEKRKENKFKSRLNNESNHQVMFRKYLFLKVRKKLEQHR